MANELKKLYLALLHYPCINKQGAITTTATTNLDIHDIARLAATYDVGGYYLVQPLLSQHAMIERILHHWRSGPGKQLHPDRPTALEKVNVVFTLEEIAQQLGDVTWVATTATPPRPTTSITTLAQTLKEATKPIVLMFGTGWGLAPQVLTAADIVLDPIKISTYHHLSVRSAVTIYVDRIWCARKSLS